MTDKYSRSLASRSGPDQSRSFPYSDKLSTNYVRCFVLAIAALHFGCGSTQQGTSHRASGYAATLRDTLAEATTAKIIILNEHTGKWELHTTIRRASIQRLLDSVEVVEPTNRASLASIGDTHIEFYNAKNEVVGTLRYLSTYGILHFPPIWPTHARLLPASWTRFDALLNQAAD